MATYRLSNRAKDDLRRIYRYGLETWGEAQADIYYNALFDRFDELIAEPLRYPAIEHIAPGYRRSASGSDSIYYRIINGGIEIVAVLGWQDAVGIVKGDDDE